MCSEGEMMPTLSEQSAAISEQWPIGGRHPPLVCRLHQRESREAREVGFNGQPAVLAEEEIEALRTYTVTPLGAEPHPYLTVGRRGGIRRGTLAGMDGILVRRKNALRVVLSIDLIIRSVSVEVDANDLE